MTVQTYLHEASKGYVLIEQCGGSQCTLLEFRPPAHAPGQDRWWNFQGDPAATIHHPRSGSGDCQSGPLDLTVGLSLLVLASTRGTSVRMVLTRLH